MAKGNRSQIVLRDTEAFYHAWSRCVRQQRLCGRDPISKRNYEHRRQWIKMFARELGRLMAIEVGFYAIMSNHMHFLLRSRPGVAAQWSAEEVVRRFISLNRLIKSVDGKTYAEPTAKEIAAKLGNEEEIKKMRSKLASVSKFMGAMNENIAVRSNREDGCKGRFWDGRFDCRRLDTLSAVLICAIYIDLNQIRSGETTTPETSTHTSAYLRIQALKSGRGLDSHDSPAAWLARLSLPATYACGDESRRTATSGQRASDKGMLPLTLDQYLELLDIAGKQPRKDKPSGSIPSHLAPILERLGVREQKLATAVDAFDHGFGSVVGSPEKVALAARNAKKRCFRGISMCREVFV